MKTAGLYQGMVLAIGVVMAVSCSALAEQASREDYIKALAPPRGLTKGMSPGEQNSPKQSINLEVGFDFNSAALTPQAIQTLTTLAEAMNDPALRPYRFRIVGHTTPQGSASQEQKISEQRAVAVRNFLIGRQIRPERMETEGQGTGDPLDRLNPASPSNRRVQIINLGQ